MKTRPAVILLALLMSTMSMMSLPLLAIAGGAFSRGDDRHTQRDDPPEANQGGTPSENAGGNTGRHSNNILRSEVTHSSNEAPPNNDGRGAGENRGEHERGANSPRTWNSDRLGRENSGRENSGRENSDRGTNVHTSPNVVRFPDDSARADTHADIHRDERGRNERTQTARDEAHRYNSRYAVARGDDGKRESAHRDNEHNGREHQDGSGARFGHHDDNHHDFDRPSRDARGYALDNRFNHGRYYPPRGFESARLSRNAFVTYHYRDPFYFDGGIWYRPFGPRFVVVAPPFGLFVPLLPPYYTTLWVRGFPYFYADDVYYRWYPERRGYVVSEPPAESDVRARPTVGDDIFMYPKNKQSDAQQATDRYECHRWALDQTGFDPTLPLGGVSESNSRSKREDYRRAMSACLEGRGYSVK